MHPSPNILPTIGRVASPEPFEGCQARHVPGIPTWAPEAKVLWLNCAVRAASCTEKARTAVDISDHETMPLRIDDYTAHRRNVTRALLPLPPSHRLEREGSRHTSSALPALSERHPSVLRAGHTPISGATRGPRCAQLLLGDTGPEWQHTGRMEDDSLRVGDLPGDHVRQPRWRLVVTLTTLISCRIAGTVAKRVSAVDSDKLFYFILI